MEPTQKIMTLAEFREKHIFKGVTPDWVKPFEDMAGAQGFQTGDVKRTFDFLKIACGSVEAIKRQVNSNAAHGVGMTLCGPSGSGKTSLLFAILNKVRSRTSIVRYCSSPLEFLEEYRNEDNDLCNVAALGIDALEMLLPKGKGMTDSERNRALAALSFVLETRGKAGKVSYMAIQTEYEKVKPEIILEDPEDQIYADLAVEALGEREDCDFDFPQGLINRMARFAPHYKVHTELNWWRVNSI